MKAASAGSRASVDNIPVIRGATPNSQRAQAVATDATPAKKNDQRRTDASQSVPTSKGQNVRRNLKDSEIQYLQDSVNKALEGYRATEVPAPKKPKANVQRQYVDRTQVQYPDVENFRDYEQDGESDMMFKDWQEYQDQNQGYISANERTQYQGNPQGLYYPNMQAQLNTMMENQAKLEHELQYT